METYNTLSKLELAQKKVKKIKRFYIHALVYVVVNLFIIVSNSISSAKGFEDKDGYMTAIFWGIGLLAHALSVFGEDIVLGKTGKKEKLRKLWKNNKKRLEKSRFLF